MAVHPGEILSRILTTPIDGQTQERLYEHIAALYDRFPDIPLDSRILTPQWYEDGDALGGLPADARPVVSPAA